MWRPTGRVFAFVELLRVTLALSFGAVVGVGAVTDVVSLLLGAGWLVLADADGHCRVCADACRRCEQACTQLLSSFG